MKYEETKGSGLNKKTLQALEKIAMAEDGAISERGGLEIKMNDGLDFPEIYIANLARMLERAYKLGYTECYEDHKLHKQPKDA